MTSPNDDHIFYPPEDPHLDRNVQMGKDGLYGELDPLLHPQNFQIEYDHIAVMPAANPISIKLSWSSSTAHAHRTTNLLPDGIGSW